MGLDELYGSLPEEVLIFFLLLLPLLEILGFKKKWKGAGETLFFLAIIGTLVAIYFLLPEKGGVLTVFSEHFKVTQKTQLIKIFLLILALPLLFIRERVIIGVFKYYFLLLSVLLGALVAISSNSFITLLIGIELMAIPLYALVLNLDAPRLCAEATMKFIFFDSIITSCFLLGVVFLYLDKGHIFIANSAPYPSPYFIMGSVFLFVSFLIKLTLVPFHFWSPDVYQGSDYKTIYILTIIKKAAMFFILLNLWENFIGLSLLDKLQYPIIFLATLSTVWGNLVLYTQNQFKRFIAYSSIAQMGYLLSAFLIKDIEIQNTAVFIYFMMYALSLLAIVIPSTKVKLRKSNKFFFVLGLLSLAGIPPLPGFWAKIYLLGYLIDAGQPLLAFTLFLASYIGIYSYFRIISYFTLEDNHKEMAEMGKARLSLS